MRRPNLPNPVGRLSRSGYVQPELVPAFDQADMDPGNCVPVAASPEAILRCGPNVWKPAFLVAKRLEIQTGI